VPNHREDIEEVINALTHVLGAILALIGGFFLLTHAFHMGPWHFIGCLLYSTSIFITFVASAFYHAASDPLIKHRYRVLDHSTIYIAIAGGYSPILLISLIDNWGLLYCAVVWLMAIGGIMYKFKHTGENEEASLATYLILGWVGLLIVHDIMDSIPEPGLWWLLMGGIFYTTGVYFYYNDSKRWYHTIWHMFVLLGCICHYIMVMFYIMQPS
jgi:hemolysin III